MSCIRRELLHERVIALPSQLRERLSSSTAEDLQHFAKKIVARFGAEAVKKSLTPELKYAVALEYIGKDYKRVHHIEELKEFSPNEKYQLLSTIQKNSATELPEETYLWLSIDNPTDRFMLVKESFQFVYDLRDQSVFYGFMRRDRIVPFKDNLNLIRNFVKQEVRTELAEILMQELKKINNKFSKKANSEGTFDNKLHQLMFWNNTNKFLYLAAACAGVSNKADIDNLKSYLISALDDMPDFITTARILAYQSRHPGLEADSSLYMYELARILRETPLTLPATKGEYMAVVKELETLNNKFEKLNDSLNLLETYKKLALCLTALEKVLQTLPQEHKTALLPEIQAIKKNFIAGKKTDESFPYEVRQAIKVRVNRLLLAISVCSNTQHIMQPSTLGPLVEAIVNYGGNNINTLYLFSALNCLIQSTPEIQGILTKTENFKGGNSVLLASLGLVRLHNAELISTEELKAVCKNIQESSSRVKLKKGSNLNLWLTALKEIQCCPNLKKASIGPTLKKLTHNMWKINEALGYLINYFDLFSHMRKNKNEMTYILKLLGLVEHDINGSLEMNLETVIALAKGCSESQQSKWLWQQRDSYLLITYLQKITKEATMKDKDKAELISLIHQFIEGSESHQFVESRQSASNNPHLQAVYKMRPDLKKGWRENFRGFDNINDRLSKTTLELTEDPWDLFISGFDVNSCQSPDSHSHNNCALMSYVMDGRNAMIVEKNQKRKILKRAVIRIVLDNNNQPALFIERIYPSLRRVNEDSLFMVGACEIAAQMKLSLYQKSAKHPAEKLTMLDGRAPFDYFDSLGGGLQNRGRVVIKGERVASPKP